MTTMANMFSARWRGPPCRKAAVRRR